MNLQSRSYADARVVLPAGRIDHASADDFETALGPHLTGCAAGGHTVVLDLSGVDYMSSVGLRVLMAAAKQARQQRGRVLVCGLQGTLREIFHIARFDLVFDVRDDLPAALGAVSTAALTAYQDG